MENELNGEIIPTWRYAYRVWWSQTWRSWLLQAAFGLLFQLLTTACVVIIPKAILTKFVGVFGVGLVMTFIAGILFCDFFALKIIFNKNYKDFSLRVKNEQEDTVSDRGQCIFHVNGIRLIFIGLCFTVTLFFFG